MSADLDDRLISLPAPAYLPDAQCWRVIRAHDRYPITSDGPWRDEPDKAQWVDATSDLDCLIVRNHFGNLCGYVGVPNTHPAYGQSYDAMDERVSVHGGLTFADTCSPAGGWIAAPGCSVHHPHGEEGWRPRIDDIHEHYVQADEAQPSSGICHVPAPGRPHDVWWLGFDCGHAFDLSPGMRDWELANYPQLVGGLFDLQARYRTFSYVASECTGLARQLAALLPA